ncbi:hypothetical protein INT46_008219 [Mucor plumbeus]|uniref:Uncharacterized protein n=1 Tax=Mucor plumbeus TaxID=97098 RepID=A0A8H7QBK6_9FUNG|nr:hypothetical protein INT46_008219 [Mucor plumbeus]
MVQLLDILEYLVMNIANNDPSNDSELTCYRKTAHALDILFRSTKLRMIDGEHCSKATKDARNINMRYVEDENDKKDLLGRKIDLVIQGSQTEISSSEWKKKNTTFRIIQEQRVKNLRTNSAMLHKLSKLIHKDDTFLCGMDWVGYVGFLFAISPVSDTHSVYSMGDLIFLKDTLDTLFKYKHHHQNLLKIIEPAYEKFEVRKRLNMLRSPPTDSTPKRKRQKKTNAENKE